MYIQRWGIFYTTCEQRKWNRYEQRRSETSGNQTYPNTGKQHNSEYNMKYKHRQQRWQSGHGKYIHLYNKRVNKHFELYLYACNFQISALPTHANNRPLSEKFALFGHSACVS
jgi:hypothetical protein